MSEWRHYSRLLCTMRAVWLNIPGNLTNVRLIQYCWPKIRGVWVHNGARLTTFRGARELALDLQDKVFICSSSSSVNKYACTNFYSSVIIARFTVMQLIAPTYIHTYIHLYLTMQVRRIGKTEVLMWTWCGPDVDLLWIEALSVHNGQCWVMHVYIP